MLSRILSSLILVSFGGGHLFVSVSPAHTDIIPPRIDRLAQRSDLIVLAKVESVTGERGDKTRRAKAVVSEAWKGPKSATIEYGVAPWFPCDISTAEKGEKVLLFLVKDKKRGWVITWSGQGRMPLKTINGKDYLTHSREVIFPAQTPSIKVSESEDELFDNAVELRVVKEFVQKAIDQRE